MQEARELTWAAQLAVLKARLSPAEMADRAKSADWKVAVATVMKEQTTASNPWLAAQLAMGSFSVVCRLTSACRAGRRARELYRFLTSLR
jgi:hypothetical protein